MPSERLNAPDSLPVDPLFNGWETDSQLQGRVTKLQHVSILVRKLLFLRHANASSDRRLTGSIRQTLERSSVDPEVAITVQNHHLDQCIIYVSRSITIILTATVEVGCTELYLLP